MTVRVGDTCAELDGQIDGPLPEPLGYVAADRSARRAAQQREFEEAHGAGGEAGAPEPLGERRREADGARVRVVEECVSWSVESQ